MARWSICVLVVLALALAGVSCLDFSGLDEGFNQVPESPPRPGPPAADVPTDEADAGVDSSTLELAPTDIDFEALEGFTLAAVEPATGPADGAQIVMLLGSGFHDAMDVFFGQTKAMEPFVVNANIATVETPPHPPGTVDVEIMGQDGQTATLSGAFTFVAPLAVNAIEPALATAEGGTPVVVTGTGFDPTCALFLAGRKASFVAVPDSFTIQAVTPPGHCGKADVNVICTAGQAQLKHGFFYFGPPTVTSLSPAAVPEAGGAPVALKGKSFTPGMAILVGELAVPAHDVEFLSPGEVSFLSPPGLPGLYPLKLATECGEATLPEALLLLAAPDETSPVAVVGFSPPSLPACLGGKLTVGFSGCGDPDSVELSVGGQSGPLLTLDEDLGAAVVLLPPSAPGPADVELACDNGFAVAAKAFQFAGGAALKAITPASGDVKGGTAVLLEGCGFQPGAEVRFGPSVATSVVFESDGTLAAVSPPGPPGPVDVTVVTAAGAATLPNGFSYVTGAPVLHLLDPNYGAIAGGTYVRFHGAGLPLNGTYSIGEKACFDVHVVDASTVVARTPPAKVGTYEARVDWPGGSAALQEAFTYYDPKSKKGGTWGEPIDEALNVTVLDSSTGKGLAGALVVVGSDPATPHKGFTDELGQITFSAPGLFGKQQITATRPGYSLYSVVHFDAENVTVHLTPILLPDYGSAWQPDQGWVGGKVIGLEKYLVIPPGNCAYKSTGTILCQACDGDAQCLDPVTGVQAACVEIGDTGKFCATPCLVPEDCPEGFFCGKMSWTLNVCIPKGGERAARCTSSKASMFGYPPDPGPGAQANVHDIYFIATSTGELAIVCYGGYVEADTGSFIPTVMGLARNVIVLPGDVLKDQDVVLDIPLDRQARIAFHDLPFHPQGIRTPYLISSIELGKDGYMNLPKEPVWVDEGQYYLLSPLPDVGTGELTGASFSLYGSIQSNTMMSLPYAVRMETEVESLFGDGLILSGPEGLLRLHPPVDGDVVGLEFGGSQDVYVATNRGELLHFDGLMWTPVGLPDGGESFTTLVEDDAGGLWLGGAEGSVWHFDTVSWGKMPISLGMPINAIWAGGGQAALVTDSVLVTLTKTGPNPPLLAPPGHSLLALWGAAPDKLWILSDLGTVWTRSPDGWVEIASFPNVELTAIDGRGLDDVWVAGKPATIIHFAAEGYVEFQPDPYLGLAAIQALPGGGAVAAGEDGLLVSLVNNALVRIETGTFEDFTCLDHDPVTGTIAASGVQSYNLGPFMPFPRIDLPSPETPFDWSAIKWGFHEAEAQADYHYLILSNADGFPFWTMTVDGPVTEVPLPPIVKMLGVNVIPEGEKRLNLTSSMDPFFNIDYYTLNDFNMFRKISWAVDYKSFE